MVKKQKKEAVPTPGSSEAVAQGCTCPVTDNRYGAGILIGKDLCFYHFDGCPLHGTNKEKPHG